jgi:hypothetical protein
MLICHGEERLPKEVADRRMGNAGRRLLLNATQERMAQLDSHL